MNLLPSLLSLPLVHQHLFVVHRASAWPVSSLAEMALAYGEIQRTEHLALAGELYSVRSCHPMLPLINVLMT